MKLTTAIDEYLADKRMAGQINSAATEKSYRGRLELHAADVSNRDPRTTNREDVKRTLRRWHNPNTQANARAILVSFYRWAVEEGIRKDNPAEQTRRPKKRKPSVYRLRRQEVVALLHAALTVRERRVIHIGLLAGARNAELRGLQRRHFAQQPGAVWISPDIGKGGRERYIPVLPELRDVADEILENVGDGEYVVCAQRSRGGHEQTQMQDLRTRPASAQSVYRLVGVVARRAGIEAHVHPHLLRHAFGDHVTRQAGIRAAQAVLGHASIDTTQSTYTGAVTLDELTAALAFFRYEPLPLVTTSTEPVEAPSGFEPEDSAAGAGTGDHADHDHGGPHADAPDGDPRRAT